MESTGTSDSSARIYFWIGLFVTLAALGLPLIGVTVNVWLGGAILAIAFFCIVRAFWIWERSSRFHIVLRIGTVAIAAVLYFGLAGRQIINRYRQDHPHSTKVGPAPPASQSLPTGLRQSQTESRKGTTRSQSDITWNFDTKEAQFAFLGMQTIPGVVSEPLINGFQAHGKSNLDEPILHFSGFLRSDTTNETFPIVLARDNKFLRPEETLGIPRKSEFDLYAKLPSNHPEGYAGDGMNASTFLRQYPELTFVFQYDEKKYVKHFSKKDIWTAVENFRKQSLGYDKP